MLKRNFDEKKIKLLKSDKFFNEKLLPDIKKGEVFPAFRDEKISFYHKGGNLFLFNGKCFKTNIKYASVCTLDRKGKDKDYVLESDIQNLKPINSFFDDYKRIKENCSQYNSSAESKGVYNIYKNFSFTKENNKSDIVFLDIEIAFQSNESPKPKNQIDILLFNKKEKKLIFCEAKHYSNKEIWSLNGNPPEVIGQIKRYEEQIEKENENNNIIEQYKKYIYAANSLFNVNLPDPIEIEDKVTLIMFGFDNDQCDGGVKQFKENMDASNIKYKEIDDIKKNLISFLYVA